MRILYHHRTRSEDAQGIHIQEMVKAFRDIGNEVEIVALISNNEEDGEKTQRTLWSRFTRFVPDWLYELMSLAYNLYGYKNLCRAIRLKKPDLIYERYSLNTFCGIWASKRFGIPLALEVNAPLYYEQNKLGRLTFKKLAQHSERWICSNSTKTIVVSEVMKEILKQEGVPDDKMVVMPNGIDPNKFNPHISGESVRQRYGLNGKLIIGFVGWFRKWHGLEVLLETFKESGLGKRGVSLMLVGDGPESPNLHYYTQKHDLHDHVIFTGPIERDEIPAHIAAMDIAVQPSAPEYACPMKIFEYMAIKKCIVAPDQPNIREILQNGINGYLFRPDNREHFKEVLLHLIRNQALRQSAGEKAYETVVSQGYIWITNAQKTLNLLFGEVGS